MIDEGIEKRLIEAIGQKRYEHSLRVMEVAQELADFYGLDREKAGWAGLLHDCAKYQDKSLLLKKSDNFGIIEDIVMENNIELLHAPLGAIVAREEYKIRDEDVLNSIKNHTTGRVAMSDLEKVIFLADYIEPGRNFPGVENVRELKFQGLDRACLKAMDQTIGFLLKKNSLISSQTIDARNSLLVKK